jgi:hypothetical protein
MAGLTDGRALETRKKRMNLISIKMEWTLPKSQNTGDKIKFPGWLLYAVSTLLVVFLSYRLYEPQYHPYLFRVIASRTILVLIGGLAGYLAIRFLILSGRHFLRILGYLTGAIWAAYHWETVLVYFQRIRMGLLDPILGKDIAFYLFDLPFYEILFTTLFCLIAVSLICLFVKLYVQGDQGNCLQWKNCRGRILQNRYDWLYIHLGLLMFLLAWGRYLERYDQLYWQLGPNFTIDITNASVLLPSFGLVFVAMITGSFFLIFPFIRSRLPILHAVQKLSTNRTINPNLRLIRCVLAMAMLMLWHTAPQTSQLPVIQASATGLRLPFSKPDEFRLREYQEYSSKATGFPFFFNGFESGQGQDSLMVNR